MPPCHHCLHQRRLLHNFTIINILLLIAVVVVIEGDAKAGSTKFDFGSLTLGNTKLIGDAHLKNGSIRLSRDLPVPNSGAGRALYAEPIRIRHPTTRLPVPFSTFFSFTITNLNPSSIGGGLAFLVTPDARSIGDAGGFLGLTGADTPPVVAVEFDTLMDVEFEDINGNHVGVDLNNLVSAQIADLDSATIDLKSGNIINAWINYGGAGLLEVFISYATDRPAEPLFSFPVDIAKFLNHDFVYVGFSGSTQGSTEIHSIEWWSFSSSSDTPAPPSTVTTPPPASPSSNSSVLPAAPAPSEATFWTPAESPSNASSGSYSTTTSPPASPSGCRRGLCRQGPAAIAGVATASVFFAAACAGLLVWGFARRAKTRTIKRWNNLADASEIVKSPREFSYRELTTATRGFDPSRIIGHGAFGTVYKGIVPATGAIIAVKRCINSGDGDNAGQQARAEFLSELSIIASLRHRNLVRLQGWCHEKGEILLVYDYMIHGSLDKALFNDNRRGLAAPPPLAWRHRRKILLGVASALAYLHHECERQVIHRDVKSSNVMLDEGYQARLGDFGLARQVEHDHSPDATVTAGTMGYLAPEYLLTGRATEKSDVFSFGAVALEVATGRRPIDGDESGGGAGPVRPSGRRRGNNLVEWVWGLHAEGRVIEAADGRLKGEFDEGEMRRMLLVGLACSSPDPAMRPGMRAVVQMLSGEADPPFVPASKPSMSFSTTANHLLTSLRDSVSDYNAMVGLNISTSSSSSSISLTSTFKAIAGGSGG